MGLLKAQNLSKNSNVQNSSEGFESMLGFISVHLLTNHILSNSNYDEQRLRGL